MRSAVLFIATLTSGFILNAQTWSSWRPDPAFHGIEVRERCTGFNEFASAYIWDVQLRNTYHSAIDLFWAADPETLHGQAAETDRALSVKPGEVVDGRHSVAQDCAGTLTIRVNEVKTASAAAPRAQVSSSQRHFEGRWASKDPEPLKKQVLVQVSGDTVTGTFSSPSLSFEISSPLPDGLTKMVSVKDGNQK